MRKLLLLATTLALSAAMSAQSPLTTLFASNNSGSVGGCVYYDITVNTQLTIIQIDVNTQPGVAGSAAPGSPISIDVYLTAAGGTYVGNTANPAAWTLVDSGSGVAAANNVPSPCSMNTGIALAPGTYGVQIKANGFSQAYTNGNGANQNYSTTEMSIALGGAQNVQYSGLFSPRVANTNIHYGIGTGPFFIAGRTNYGAGCYNISNTYYENFAAGSFDLQGAVGVTNSFLMAPNGSGGYVLAPGSNNWFTPVSANLGLSDDSVSGPQSLPFNLSHPGGTTNVLRVGSNGMIFPTASTSTDFSPSVAELLSGPQRWCPAWRDLNPSSGGTTHFDIDPSNTVVYATWSNVPNFGGTVANNIQVAFFNTGVIEYRYRDMDLAGATITGYTTGNGASDPGTIDLSVQIPLGYSSGPGSASLALNASARPLAGTTVQMNLTNIPAANLGVILLSFTQLSPSLELSGLLMPGCFQHIVTAGAATVGIVFGNGSANLGIPANPFYLGTNVYLQGAAFVSGFNPLGVVSSNGVHLRVGNI